MDDDKKPNPSNPSPIIYVNPNKKYGLIFNNKSAAANKPKPMDSAAARQKPAVKPCIFGDDDDLEDDESDAKSGSKKPASYQVNTGSNLLKKQTQIEIEKALKEDPTAFEYDEVYDKLEEQKNKVDPKAAAKEKSNEPKYIAGIMKAAAKRQMEFEKLQDRKVQKDREAEGDLWADKEVFVTTAYKKKLEERERLAEEERQQEQIEALLDVRKQKDMSGFYYSMLKLRTGEMVIEEEGEKQRREAKEKEDAVKFKEKSAAKQKTYRTAAREEEEEEEKEEEKEKGTKEDEVVEKTEEDVKPVEIKEEKVESVEKPSQANQEATKPKEEDKSKEKIKKEENKENVIEEKKLSKEEQQKLRLEKMFKKRTVGEVFDHELAEYFLRKNQSLSLKNFVEKE